jgi:hypothetical protein
MNVFDDFDLLLSNFNRREEPLFLRDIREYAETNRKVVLKTFSLLLKTRDLNIQLKYLLLKSAGELKYEELVPILKESLFIEKKVQIIKEAVNSLTAIGTFSAYRVVVDFLIKHRTEEYADKVERSLRDLFIKNPLAFHFDVFYRNRGGVTGIQKSSEFLIRNLPDEFLPELLTAINSRYHKIKYEILRVLKNRPTPIFFATIYNSFRDCFESCDNELFLIHIEAMVANASVSKARTKIFEKLKSFVPQLEGDRKIVFCIALLKMNNKELIHYISAIYPQLNYERKVMVYDNLNPDDYIYYMEFVREQLVQEPNEALLARNVQILVKANEYQLLFDTVDAEKGLRKTKLLDMILDNQPRDIHGYIQRYVTPSQNNRILRICLEYLVRRAADTYYELISEIFFSGVAPEIKTYIIRNVGKWDDYHQKHFMEAVFKDLKVVAPFKKDYLLAMLGVLNNKIFDEELEEKILNRILVMMEEATLEEIVNFIYFFDKYKINSDHERELIINELRLIQNTLLKSSNEQNLVRMIHVLIKDIEKRAHLKT